jgi:hypothetical protein
VEYNLLVISVSIFLWRPRSYHWTTGIIQHVTNGGLPLIIAILVVEMPRYWAGHGMLQQEMMSGIPKHTDVQLW